MKLFLAGLALALQLQGASSQISGWSGVLPDPHLTPGALNTNLTIQQIVQLGFVTHSQARHVTQAQERAIFQAYLGRQPAVRSDFEIDHLLSLELGGCNDSANLWPQSYKTYLWNAHAKDKLEDFMAASVRQTFKAEGAGSATRLLKTYQMEIAHNWTNAYVRYLGQPAPGKIIQIRKH